MNPDGSLLMACEHIYFRHAGDGKVFAVSRVPYAAAGGQRAAFLLCDQCVKLKPSKVSVLPMCWDGGELIHLAPKGAEELPQKAQKSDVHRCKTS